MPPIEAETYLKGYSIEHLRELENTPLTTPEAREGFYFHESLKQLFKLIWEGFPKKHDNASGQQSFLDDMARGASRPLPSIRFRGTCSTPNARHCSTA